VITTNTLERSDGLTKLSEVLEEIKKVIEANGGVFTIKMAVCLNMLELHSPSRCHCHSLSLAPVNPDWFYLSGTCLPGGPGHIPEKQ